MNSVKVDREKLIATLTENRANHKAEYDEAIAGYQTAAAQALRDQAERVLVDPQKPLSVSLPRPEDHSEEYDEVIAMLGWSTEGEVEVTYSDFVNYVLDKWQWKERFASTTAMYNTRR